MRRFCFVARESATYEEPSDHSEGAGETLRTLNRALPSATSEASEGVVLTCFKSITPVLDCRRSDMNRRVNVPKLFSCLE